MVSSAPFDHGRFRAKLVSLLFIASVRYRAALDTLLPNLMGIVFGRR